MNLVYNAVEAMEAWPHTDNPAENRYMDSPLRLYEEVLSDKVESPELFYGDGEIACGYSRIDDVRTGLELEVSHYLKKTYSVADQGNGLYIGLGRIKEDEQDN